MSEQNDMGRTDTPSPGDRPSYFVHIFLFVVTLFTTWFAGAGGLDAAQFGMLAVFNAEAFPIFKEAAGNGLMYMGAIMSILLSHEMGHYIMARRNRVPASLPYFIPMPFLLFGTFGAVIVMKGRIRSRNALMEVGAAGPLAGMAVALPVLIIGLSMSKISPIPEGALIEGQSLIYMAIKRIIVGPIPTGMDVMLHPMAWAGWIGLLVTMLNLLPIGQLDGGHIFYALFGKAHDKVSRLFLAGLFVLGLGIMGYSTVAAMRLHLDGDAFLSRVLTGMNWVVLGLMLLIAFGRKKGRGLSHPPTDDDSLSLRHRLVGIGCLVLFVLCFMPVPIQTAL
jgi:membrane-associated protease RseP (regulator of RpoE activity)